jgi:hypothetical protein
MAGPGFADHCRFRWNRDGDSCDSESGELSLPEPAKAEDVEQAPPSTSSIESLQYLVTDGAAITFTVGDQLSRLPLANDGAMRIDALPGQLNLD